MNIEPNKKFLSILKFALEKNGVQKETYLIGNHGDEKMYSDCLCLLKSTDNNWRTLYIEKGASSLITLHPSLHEAATYFYWKLVRKDTPWDYLQEWEE